MEELMLNADIESHIIGGHPIKAQRLLRQQSKESLWADAREELPYFFGQPC